MPKQQLSERKSVVEGEADQEQRERMIRELDANIAVRAAAGSGKTRSTVDRIVQMALDSAYRKILPRLVVVTYTNAAADELRTRARNNLIEDHHEELRHLAGEIIPQFGQIFFGTIHSFCMRLLREFGHRIGLPSELENLDEDVEEVHERFRREREPDVWKECDRSEILEVCRFGLTFDDLVEIAKELSLLPMDCGRWLKDGALEKLNILAEARKLRLDPSAFDGCKFVPRSRENVVRYQKKYEAFCAVWNGEAGAATSLQMLEPADSGGCDIEETSQRVMAKVNDWYARSILKLALSFAAEFQKYRWERGGLTYNDQILLADRLVADAEVREILRRRDLRVILDEAQDTTPMQFRILAELTLSLGSDFGQWPLEKSKSSEGPRPGSFVMVGDAQQCIYASSGAEIDVYRKHSDALEVVEFHTTFRCSKEVVNFVNQRHPGVLDGECGQAAFVPLKTRKEADQGQVGRWVLKPDLELDAIKKPGEARRFESEARQLVGILQELQPAGLGASSWSQVAILMPRNKWLTAMARHLRRAGIPVRMTARHENRDDTSWRWLTALLVSLARGNDGYELAGVLREIFGIRDDELAKWIFVGGSLDLEFEHPPPGAPSEMAATMAFLRDLKTRIRKMPALAAVEEVIRSCKLEERLGALTEIPRVEEPWEMSLRVIGRLRGRAASAEADGLSWEMLAEELWGESDANAPELPAGGKGDGIVLMTCQKAKGQEWPVVILPGLYRPMKGGGDARRKKIRVLQNAAGASIRVKGISDLGWTDARARARERSDQEMRRVYYVACTRAKRNLIFVDARAIWPAPKKEGVSMKPVKAMSAVAESDAWFGKIDPWKREIGEVSRATGKESSPAELKWYDWNQIVATRVVRPSQKDPDRSDSDLDAREDRSASELRVEPLRGALVYGNWWHETMFRADWASNEIGDLLKSFVDDLPASELRERGRAQIETLLRSELFRELTLPGIRFHRELPYVWMPAKNTIEDGKIDLVYQSGDVWNVVDWKTDVVHDRVEAETRAQERYAGQLSSYVEALEQFDIKIGEARLYFTAVGETVRVLKEHCLSPAKM